MRIKRVDEKTVKCFLSNEELEAYEIDYKDFIMHSDKAKQVVQEILTQAAKEVGYKPPKFAFDVQIMVLQDQGILLTFSESDTINHHAQQILEYLKEMKQTLEKSREQLGIADLIEEIKENENHPVQAADESAQVGQPVKQVQKSEHAVFVFESIRDVMSYAAALPSNLRIQSALYEMENQYYLCLYKGSAAYERFSRSCIQAMEFGRLHTAEKEFGRILQEHGKCLISEKALQKLRG